MIRKKKTLIKKKWMGIIIVSLFYVINKESKTDFREVKSQLELTEKGGRIYIHGDTEESNCREKKIEKKTTLEKEEYRYVEIQKDQISWKKD